MNTTPTSPARRAIAALVALALSIGPLAPGAYAAQTVLTDQPIAAKVAAKPNIIYTLDDSGSMTLNYIPDYVSGTNPVNTPPGYCRHPNGTTVTACNTDYLRGLDEPMFASEFNRLYYNPNVNYEPPVDGAGNQATAAAPNGAPAASAYRMQTAANTTNWTVVRNDPYLAPTGSATNVAAKVLTRVMCNTDWPRDTSVNADDANSGWAEVGDTANGEYTATAGRDCRINGTAYDALDGAPAVSGDYNYPYFRNSGSVDDPKYFYRSRYYSSSHRYRNLWCKTNGAGWPQSCVNTTTCVNPPVTITPSVPQTCVFTGNRTSSNQPPYTYSPAGCNTNPLYQWTWATSTTDCVGTIGVECLACNRTGTTVVTGKNGACRLTSTLTGGSGASCNCTSGAGCALPACPNYNPPDICDAAGYVQSCTPRSSAACNTTYGGSGGTGGYTLLNDANGPGDTCRHNNSTGAYISNRFTYPQTPTNGNTYSKLVSNSSCGTIPSRVAIPNYYYTIAAVSFCNNAIGTNNDQWRGFGTGACQAKNDLSTFRFVKYGQFTRVGLVNDGRTFAYTDPFTGIAGTRTYAEEMTNYANWHAYYRTRILAAKTTSAIAFNNVDKTYRAGFHTMNFTAASGNTTANWLDIDDFDTTHRSNWYAKLFSIAITPTMTPTLDAMIRIGEVVKQGAGAVAGLPGHTDPFPTNAATGLPVTCTNNYHILFTDGETNQLTLPTVAGEVDGSTIPARVVNGTMPPDPGGANPERTVASFASGSPWPAPFKDVASPTANTLADVSLYYWMQDLRPTLTNDVPSSDGRAGKDLDWKRNPAWWQHVSLSAISFGSDGLLDSSDVSGKTDQIAAGTANWFTSPNYPRPPNSPNNPSTGTKPATAIDDLWHATANSRGTFVYAETPIEVAYGLGKIISGIGNNPKARVGAAFSGQSLTGSNNFIFEATIESGWSGDLKKVTIDTTTGAQGAVRWSAASQLDALLATPAAGTSPALDTDNTWYLNRRIVTKNTSSGTVVPFLYANLAATQLATLGNTAALQQRTIAYLRGGSTFGAGPTPPSMEGTRIGQFRQRNGKLGNISDSKPLVVGPPRGDFSDVDDYGYAAYKSANASRALRVHVGANDGMFHVFDGADDTGPNTGGSETFAYIPSSLFNNSPDEGGKPKGIRALTFQDGGAPIFKHHFYVNASPRTMDVDFANCGTNSACTPDWRTIVVSGLGKGGNTYFAIDATNPSVTTEAQAAAKILWEYTLPGSQFSYGRPIIAKTRADGWVVVVASGYNNTTDGKGHLHFLRVTDGTLIRTLNTTSADSGTIANPSGLAQINGFTKDSRNQIIEQIYGGDLKGQLWRWDVSDPSAAAWQAKTVLLANLTDASGVPQPVTTAPQMEIDINNGTDRFVFIGTGQLLDPSDLTTPSPEQIQTMYAIRDGSLDQPSTTGLPLAPRSTLASASGVTGVGAVAPNGWYNDLPAGQRIVQDVQADLNLVAYSGTAVQPDPCLTSLPAYIYARDFTTAESLIYTGGVAQPYFFSTEGAVGLELVALDSATSSFPKLAIVFTKETNASIQPVEVKPKSFGGGHRLSWRLLGE